MMTKSYWLILFVFLSAISAKAQTDTISFSAQGGFYYETFSLELFNYNPQNHIHYTTNGNRPTAQSPLYDEPLNLDENLYSKSDIYTIVNCPVTQFHLPDSVQHCIVIRAAVFDENDSCVSKVVTNSYFIHSLGCNTHGLPAVSLCADSLDLFDYYQGIFVPGVNQSPSSPSWTGNYFCKGREWERRCNVEFYENDNSGINQEAGLRTHGGVSRRYQQKGMKLYARDEYGKKRFKHPFFDNVSLEKVKRFSLKPFKCSNWLKIGLTDPFCHHVAQGMNFDVLGTRAVVVFLNGEYWGIYYLEESIDTHYFEDHYDVNPDSCNIIENWLTLDEGDATQWLQLYNWLETADLSQAEQYDYLCSKIDIDNFIDYTVFELYSANIDWPGNNVRCWQTSDSKWRWIFYDGDGCFSQDFDVFANIVDTSNNSLHSNHDLPSIAACTLIYRRLLKNANFVEQLCSRFATAMSQTLNYEHTRPVLIKLSEDIKDEVSNQSYRFSFPADTVIWTKHIKKLNTYLKGRNQSMEAQIEAFLDVFSQEELASLVIYPNPFTDEIHLIVSSEIGQSQEVMIFDMLGRCLYHDNLRLYDGVQHFVIHPNLSSGVYVLKIGDHAQRIVRY
jgi:hypothetical protein